MTKPTNAAEALSLLAMIAAEAVENAENHGDDHVAHIMKAHCTMASYLKDPAFVRVPDTDDVARVLISAWANAEPNHVVTKFPVSYVATFADMARAVVAMFAASKGEEL